MGLCAVALRKGPDADVHVLIARLRNDPSGMHSEDVVEAVRRTGMVLYRLPRAWPEATDAEEARERREERFSETGALVLIEGYVGGTEVPLRVWARGQELPAEHSFGGDETPQTGLAPIVERAAVEGITNQVGSEGAALMEDDTHTRVIRRARDVRKRVGDENRARSLKLAQYQRVTELTVPTKATSIHVM